MAGAPTRSRPEVRLAQVFSGHSEPVYALSAGLSEGLFLSGSGDGFVGMWNVASGTFERPLANLPASIYSLCLLPDPGLLFVGLQNGQLHVVDLDRRQALRNLNLSSLGIFSLTASSDGKFVYAGDGAGRLHVIHAETQEVAYRLSLADKAIRCLFPSGREDRILAGSSDGSVYEVDQQGLKTCSSIMEAHGSSVFSVASLDASSLLTGGRDALLKRWKRMDGREMWELDAEIPAHNYTVNALALHPGGGWLASASRDKTVKLWDVESLALLKVIDLEKFPGGHTHSVNTLHWHTPQILLSAGDDRRILAWEVGV